MESTKSQGRENRDQRLVRRSFDIRSSRGGHEFSLAGQLIWCHSWLGQQCELMQKPTLEKADAASEFPTCRWKQAKRHCEVRRLRQWTPRSRLGRPAVAHELGQDWQSQWRPKPVASDAAPNTERAAPSPQPSPAVGRVSMPHHPFILPSLTLRAR